MVVSGELFEGGAANRIDERHIYEYILIGESSYANKSLRFMPTGKGWPTIALFYPLHSEVVSIYSNHTSYRLFREVD